MFVSRYGRNKSWLGSDTELVVKFPAPYQWLLVGVANWKMQSSPLLKKTQPGLTVYEKALPR